MKRTKSGRKLKYPWPDMKPGVFFGPFKVPTGNHLHSAARQWSAINKEGRWQFTTEKVGEGKFKIKRIR